MEVLQVGFGSFKFGTGVTTGWALVQYWLDKMKEPSWHESRYVCPNCNSRLLEATIPAPFMVIAWYCPGCGAKFSFECTD